MPGTGFIDASLTAVNATVNDGQSYPVGVAPAQADDLLADPLVLLSAEPEQVLAALSASTSPGAGRVAAAYRRPVGRRQSALRQAAPHPTACHHPTARHSGGCGL